jgi:muramoyltetrapeptide carboxypeptidase
MPTDEQVVLFVEDDGDTYAELFDRDLESLIQSFKPGSIQAVVVGRFQRQSKMTQKILKTIFKNKKRLAGIPVIGNVDFGHTDPKITFPIGGTAKVSVTADSTSLVILEH